jgi:hypothetical protein
MSKKRQIGRQVRGMAVICGAATAVITAASAPAWADASGCNGDVCIRVTGTASSYTVSGSTRFSFRGHLQFQGPGVSGNTGEALNPNGSANGRGAGQVCVTGWQESGSSWVQVGKPCETVR